MKTLTRANPWREIEDIFDRHVHALEKFQPIGWENLTADWTPMVDISETETAFVINVEIPGINKEDVKVTVDNNILSINGTREQEKEDEGKKFHRIERSYGSFTRSFTLPEYVDEKHIQANFHDGLLNLRIEKVTVKKSKAIDVKVK